MNEFDDSGQALAVPSLWPSTCRDRSQSAWDCARQEIVRLFAQNIYGITPAEASLISATVASVHSKTVDGLGTMNEFSITLEGPQRRHNVDMLVYLPLKKVKRRGIFLGLNFKGNHAVTQDSEISISNTWASGFRRGSDSSRWPLKKILGRGYGIATAHYMDFEPDINGMAQSGVRGLVLDRPNLDSGDANSWGAIGVWAWGLSRLLDVIEAQLGMAGRNVIVHGHSRLGKAALWSAAQDSRFGAVVSNQSGCAGASLFRHEKGETISMILDSFPYWFTKEFERYRGNPHTLPIDQHQLLAAIAPRPIHVASASRDFHADPRGEFLSTLYASPIMRLFGYGGTLDERYELVADDLSDERAESIRMPPLGMRVGGRLSYHLRHGEHDVRDADWAHYLDFADENVTSSF